MPEFDRFANQYDAVLNDTLKISGDSAEYFTNYKARALARWLGPDFAGRILDFGCGVGNLSLAMQREFPDASIDGFDVSAESIQQVPARLRAQGRFVSDLSRLEPGYALIVLSNVLHHVPPGERTGLLAAVAGLSGAGGHAAVFEHNPLNPLARWVVAHCAFDTDAILLWPGETRRLLSAAGLRITRRDYIVFFPSFLARLRPLEPVLRWLPAGAQYFMAGTK